MLVKIKQIQFTPKSTDAEVYNKVRDSISEVGMLHPIVLLRRPDGDFDLVTGNYRLQAYIELGKEEIEAHVHEAGTIESVREIQMHENLMRTNRSWVEDVALTAEWHQHRQNKFGAASAKGGRPGKEKGRSGWSLRDTAQELEKSLGAVAEDINLHTALLNNPHLAKIKDKTTAIRLVKQAARRAQLEIEALDVPTSSEFQLNQVFCGDSLDVMKMIPDNTFDACITDPPWSVYRDESLTADESTVPIFSEIYRVLKPNSILYMIVSTIDFIQWTPILRKIGFEVQDYPIIWKKSGTITHGRKEWQYARDYEPIIVAAKGNATLTDGREMSSILDFPSMSHHHMVHPHEKPIELLQKLVRDCTFPGGKIIDPFGGSGVTAHACKTTDRRYVTIERNPLFYKQIVERLEKA